MILLTMYPLRKVTNWFTLFKPKTIYPELKHKFQINVGVLKIPIQCVIECEEYYKKFKIFQDKRNGCQNPILDSCASAAVK